MRFRRENDDEERPFYRQPTWLISAAFLALGLGAGLIAVLGGNGPARSDAGPPPAGPLLIVGSGEAARPAGCHTDDSDQKVPNAPPADLTWRQLNGAPVPLSASAGPVQETGPVLWCFAHTPMGSVMAASVILRQMSGDDWRAVMQQQVVDDGNRKIFEIVRSSQRTGTAQYTASKYAGFLIQSYGPAQALIRLLIQASPGVYGTVEVTVAWDGGDWKILAQPGGDMYGSPTQVNATGPFVMWKV
ncbi:hypothetical protein [Dactylosporangium sp. CA-092794]|uniref:hypothetical protein n=1 Tax=Dactylosporangium sp. CA-092794 TaxID=3239929 RepID=UPI003D8DBE61